MNWFEVNEFFTRKSCVRAATIDAADARTHSNGNGDGSSGGTRKTNVTTFFSTIFDWSLSRLHSFVGLRVTKNIVLSIYLGKFGSSDASRTIKNSPQYAWIKLNLLFGNHPAFCVRNKVQVETIGMCSWTNWRQKNGTSWFMQIPKSLCENVGSDEWSSQVFSCRWQLAWLNILSSITIEH